MRNLWIMRHYEARKIKERVAFWCAWRMPKWLVYFCSIRMIANATTGKYSSQVVPELSAMDALKRWDQPA